MMKPRFLIIDVNEIFSKEEDNNKMTVRKAKDISHKYNVPRVCQKIVIKLDKDTLKTEVLNKRKERIGNAYEIATYAPFQIVCVNGTFSGKNHLQDNQYVISKGMGATAEEVMDFYQLLKDYNTCSDYFQAVSELLSPMINLNMSISNCMKRIKVYRETNL